MRVITLGSLGLVLALAGCGSGKDSGPAGGTPGAATTGNNQDSGGGGGGPDCLQPTNMLMTLEFGYDATASTIRSTNINGTDVPSTFSLLWGDSAFQGDTSIPGPPDNWCFIEWNLDGLTNTNANPSWWFQVVVSDPGRAISNCGMESTPGAGDMVTLCEDFFYGDPMTMFSEYAWTINLGGDPSTDAAASIPYFEPYGYTEENFWGGEMSFSGYPNPVDVLAWGSQTDAAGSLILDGNSEPMRWTKYDVQGPGGLQSGFYSHFFPSYFTWSR